MKISYPLQRSNWHLVPRRRAFTLVELLTAMAVLSLMMAMLFQATDSAVRATTRTNQQMNGSRASHDVLDAINGDIASAVTVNGMTVFAKQDSARNTQLAFITRSRGSVSSNASDCRLMAVCYQLDGTKLIRRTQPVTWTDMDWVTTVVAAANSSDYSIVADNILRMEAVVLLDNGVMASIAGATGDWLSSKTSTGVSVSGGFSAILLSASPVVSTAPRVRSLLVGVVALDSTMLKLPGVSDISGSFSSPISGQSPFETWNTQIFSTTFAAVPKPAMTALQVSQTICPLR